eukprot:10798944-Prorocentrum_lima.AAC.1
MSAVVNVSSLPSVMLNIILSRPMSTLRVDVESQQAWLSYATFPQTTILLLGFQVLVAPLPFIC